MKALPAERIKKRNVRALCLCLAALALLLALFTLPAYTFETTLFTKKSGNTFVGDERYTAARAEVDAQAAAFAENKPAGAVTVAEDVTQRVNSKGETTSMVAFRVLLHQTKTAWDFIASGLPSGRLLLAALLCAVASVGLLLGSLPGTLTKQPVHLPKPRYQMRQAACLLALAALVLVGIFQLATVRMFEREIIAQLGNPVTPELERLIRAADTFLLGGTAGDQAAEILAGVTYQSTVWLWLSLPVLFLMLVSMIVLGRESVAHTLARGLLYLFVIVLCVVILYPYYVMLITVFRSNAETTDMYFRHIFPTQWVWSNVLDIINRGVLRFLGNSLLLSGGATLIALCCGIPAAYAMSRMQFRGKKAFLGFVIMSQMFAPIVLLVGISQLMNFLGLNDSILGLMLINAAFNQAFAIWLLRGTFVSISPEMEQAASIDGCSTVGALMRVLLPMAAPGIVTTLIFVFINSWNEYTISTVLISTPFKKPITVGITQFSSFNMIEWQYLFASALLATIPVVILFMFIEKQLVSGLTSGGVKG